MNPFQHRHLFDVFDVEETPEEPSDKAENFNEVCVGSRFVVTYLSGPRSGISSKFVLVNAGKEVSKQDGFSPIRHISPLGEAIIGAREGDTVEFEITDGEISVQVGEIFNEN